MTAGLLRKQYIFRLKERRFGHLNELAIVDRSPVGFAPRLVVDGWSYTIVVKDVLDECGFILVSDQDRVIYEGRPVAASARTLITSNLGGRGTAPRGRARTVPRTNLK
jgi:hypothetical protein